MTISTAPSPLTAEELHLAHNEGRNLVNFYGVDPTDAEAMALLATGLPIQ